MRGDKIVDSVRPDDRLQPRQIMLDPELLAWVDGIEAGLKSRTVREVLKLGIKAKADMDKKAEGVL